MITRITIPVSVEEREALRLLAQQEMRDPREHLRYLLRRELQSRNLLQSSANIVELSNSKDATAVVAAP